MRRPFGEAVPVAGGALELSRWRGQGPLALAVHGITGNAAWWAEVATALDGAVELVAPDLRGRCRSYALPGPYGLDAHVRDLVEVLDRYAGDRAAVVVGHSMGAYVASRLADAHADRVRALVLADGGVPLPLAAGADPVADLASRITLSWGRLDRPFDGPQDYLAYWRADPAVRSRWSPAVAAALLTDLRRDADGRWTAAVRREAVEADGAALYDPAGARLLDRPASYLIPATGGLHSPGAVRGAVGPEVRVQVVEDVDHDGLLLARPGAAAVAGAVRDTLVS